MTDKQFARQVAREMHRQRRRRRMLLWLLLLAIVAAAAMYLRCGQGWGIGGWGFGGDGDGRSTKQIIDTEPKTCGVRISEKGITVDGKPMTREETVAACKKTAGAHVKVIGDTKVGEREALMQALQEGGITIRSIEQPRSPGSGSGSN